MPRFQSSPANDIPASASRSIAAICASVNFDFRSVHSGASDMFGLHFAKTPNTVSVASERGSTRETTRPPIPKAVTFPDEP